MTEPGPAAGGAMCGVLELRVHGVNNTAPHEMLDLPAGLVHQTAGDTLGSFWRPTADGHRRLSRSGLLQPGIEREAYSWGGMARTTVGATAGTTAGAGRVVAVAARIGWTLLIPFGLVNVAYWTRKFDDGPQPKSRAGASAGGWQHARGAPSLRLAGLMLTLLMAMTAAVITLDLVAVQCYDGAHQVCTSLPSQLKFLKDWPQTRRLALLGAVPVLLIGALVALSTATRLRYEQPDPDGGGREACNATPVWPLLSTPGFWSHRRITQVTGWLHLAATAALVSVLTSWHVAFGSASRSPWELGVAASGLVALALAALSVVVHSEDAGDIVGSQRDVGTVDRMRPPLRPVTWGAVILSFVVFVVQTGTLMRRQPDPTNTRLVGASGVLVILIGALLAVSLSALLWRTRARGIVRWAPIALGAVLSLALAASAWPGAPPIVWLAAAVVAAIAAALMWSIKRANSTKHEAWGGSAPGVFLILATFFALLLSSAVAVTVGNWLNGNSSAADLARHMVERQAPSNATDINGTATSQLGLGIPLPYIWFGPALIFVGTALLAFGLIAAWRSISWADPPEAGESDEPVGATVPPGPTAATRRFAALAQRAEPLVGALAGCGGAALIFTYWAAVTSNVPSEKIATYLIDAGMWLLATSGIVVIGLLTGAKAGDNAPRPLGLAWDLICFLPRAGHPLAPPCYAERAVPELAARTRAWLDPDRAAGSSVVLSAHSLGSVLAAAAVLSPSSKTVPTQRISLLSYGSQLRAYFGRIFPELLGPWVLGIRPCLSARLWPHDPWAAETRSKAPTPKPEDESPGSLARRLGGDGGAPRWRNLWRRTDYLGFPVSGYETNSIDRPAEEVVVVDYLTEIQTHSGYPRTAAYQTALAELLDGD
jgi:hypothetical protein